MQINLYDEVVNAGVGDGQDADIDEQVREEDALLHEPIVGTKPNVKKGWRTTIAYAQRDEPCTTPRTYDYTSSLL